MHLTTAAIKTADFANAIARLEHLKKTGGIWLFTGLAGTGKTFSHREFSKTLSTSSYKIIYVPLSTVTVLEFYKSIAYGLYLDPPNKKVDIFKAIQDRVVTLSKDKRITTVAIIDEAQYLQTAILNDIKLLLNFDIDSRGYIVFVLAGQPLLNNILAKQVHESLKQRIVINYNFQGITKEEAKDYIKTRFALCGVHTEIINANALEAICACSNGSIRKLNQIVDKCLLIGHMNKANVIDTEIVLSAQNEIGLV
ncbi:MAG: ExeA family protein [Alkaliphilus sp.]